MHRVLRNRSNPPARRLVSSLGIAAVTVLAGCATTTYRTPTAPTRTVAPGIVPVDRAERVALTLSEWTPPPSMRCVLEELPSVLPEASQLLNFAELQGELEQMWNALDRPRGSVLMSVGYSATGRPDRFHLIETSLEDTTLARDVAGLIDQRLYRLEPGEPFGVRLRLTLDEQASMEVGRREACYPRWAESPALGSISEDPGVNEAEAVIGYGESALRVFMDRDGEIMDAYALGAATGSTTIAKLIESSQDAGLTGTAMLDREPSGFWFTARTSEPSRRRIAEGRSTYYDSYYSDSYCSEFWRPGSLCDPFYRSSYRSFGGYYGYAPYGYYNYGSGGWWGMAPWWYVPSTPPRGDGDGHRPPADTVIPPGMVIPPPSVPPSRPSRPVVGVGRPNYPTEGAERRVMEERERAERVRRESAAQRPGEREVRGAPLRAAPDAGDVSTGSQGRSVVRPPTSRAIVAPQPPERAPVRTERERPELQRADEGRPGVIRPPARERARPAPESRVTPPVSAPRVERSGPVRAAPSPRPSGGARPAPSPARPQSARPSSGGARPAPSSARPSGGARPVTSPSRPPSRPAPSSARPSGGARPAPARTARPSPAPASRGSRPAPARVKPSTPPPDQR